MGAAESAASLGAVVTSPAKLVFVGYLILVYSGRITTSPGEFAVAAVVFFLSQVLHDDYLRILLNRLAEQHAAMLFERQGVRNSRLGV